MSYCKDFGKDKVLYVTKEDHEKPSTVTLPEYDNGEPRGLVQPNGEINWNCPCLGGAASGPCAFEFRTAFTCFHESKSEPKGSDCLEQFSEMQKCFSEFPTLYRKGSKDDDEDDESQDLHDEETVQQLDQVEKADQQETAESPEAAQAVAAQAVAAKS